jgi:hypothetical protein
LLDSIRDAAARYATGGPFAFEPDNAEERTRTIDLTIRLSVERGLQDEASRARFLQLAVFPDEIDIPVSVATELWNASGSESKDLLKKLARLSLLQRYTPNGGAFGIHDNVRHFLLRETNAAVQAEHGRLADLLIAAFRSRDSAAARPDLLKYAYHYLLRHLKDAGRQDELDRVLLDFDWMEAKLRAAGIQSLLADYPYIGGLGALDAHRRIGRILATRSKLLTDHPRQLRAQILGRWAADDPDTAEIVQATLDGLDCNLVPIHPTFMPPGAETARLEGHEGEIRALSFLPDGRLASGAID